MLAVRCTRACSRRRLYVLDVTGYNRPQVGLHCEGVSCS